MKVFYFLIFLASIHANAQGGGSTIDRTNGFANFELGGLGNYQVLGTGPIQECLRQVDAATIDPYSVEAQLRLQCTPQEKTNEDIFLNEGAT